MPCVVAPTALLQGEGHTYTLGEQDTMTRFSTVCATRKVCEVVIVTLFSYK